MIEYRGASAGLVQAPGLTPGVSLFVKYACSVQYLHEEVIHSQEAPGKVTPLPFASS